MTNKKSEPNPIEKAIGDRATKGKETSDPKVVKTGDPYQTSGENQIPIRQSPKQIPDEPSPSEMQTLEELNWITVERLQDQYPEESVAKIVTPKSEIPVSKPENQPVTENSSPESQPPQGNENALGRLDACLKKEIPKLRKEGLYPLQEINEIDEYSDAVKAPAEDKHLTALRDYVMDTGFVVSGVAFHIRALCSQPMTTPTTTTWDFKDRASIPDMVFALLKQPGYIEGIWASLEVVMADNKGNAAWTAGIATTIAFFDVIRTLPAIKELSNEEKS